MNQGDREAANEWSGKLIGAAIEVHRQLGPGLLESAYERCLSHELTIRGIPHACQVPLPVVYKGLEIDCAYRLDIVVADTVVVELKSVDKLHPIFEAQLLTYLRLTRRWLGLIVNFNVEVLKDGIKRLVQG